MHFLGRTQLVHPLQSGLNLGFGIHPWPLRMVNGVPQFSGMFNNSCSVEKIDTYYDMIQLTCGNSSFPRTGGGFFFDPGALFPFPHGTFWVDDKRKFHGVVVWLLHLPKPDHGKWRSNTLRIKILTKAVNT